jgi:PAS domain S-box-containing protein
MSQESASLSKGSILVVDDTPANLNLLTEILSKQGYKVRLAPSGKLAIMSAQSSPPDLILLDIMMPELNGYEVCKSLKASSQTKDIPVIFISALHEVFDKVKAFEVGGVDYITKPFQVEEVLARIENQLSVGRLSRQLTEQNARLQEEIRVRQQVEAARQESAIRLRNQNIVLMELARNKALNQGDLQAALKEITEATALNMGVERVSVWLFDSTGTKLQCIDLFERNLNQHSAGVELAVARYPAYFQALSQEQLIVADNAHTDPRTQEFLNSYLTRLGIMSMLDAPIRLGGETVGVLCNEQIGDSRHWTPEDQNFVRSVADLISLAIAAQERNRTEAALRSSEEKFARAFLASPTAIAITRLTDGQFIEVNDSFLLLLGYEREEVIGHTATALNIWVNLEDPANVIQLVQDTGVVRNQELDVRTKSGEVRTVLLSAELIDIDEQTCLIVTANDISDRKRTEEALRQSEERWQLVLKGNNDGIWDWEIDTNKTFRSTRWKEILGYEDHEIESDNDEWTSRIHPDDFDRFMALKQDYLEGKIPYYTVEHRLRCKDGTYKWILGRGQAVWDEQGKPVRMVGSDTDITERKQAEAALIESERKYRALVETSQDMIWSLDTQGRFTFVNQAVKKIHGYEPEEMLGRPFTDFLSAEQISKDLEVFQHILKGDSLLHYESTHLAKDGRVIHLLFNAIALLDEQGNVIGATGTASDITARKLAEAEILRSKDLLESIFNESADAIFLVNAETVLIADCNQRAVELFEASSKEELLNIEGKTLQKESLTAQEVSSIVDEVALKGFWSRELEYVTKKGKVFWGNLAVKQIHVAGHQMHLVRVTDITERKHREEALRLIVEGTASATGKSFMHSCVRYLAQVLQVRYALIAELVNDSATVASPSDVARVSERPSGASAPTRIRTLAFWQGEGWAQNNEYDLVAPCKNVINGITCYYPQDLQALFPDAPDLVKLNAQSYLGIPLRDSDGNILGLMAVLDVKPMVHVSVSRRRAQQSEQAGGGSILQNKDSIVKIFAARAAAELKRQQIERVLLKKAKQERAIAQVVQKMRQTLDIETIFDTTTEELRQFLKCDRVAVYRFNPDWSGEFVAESVATGWISLLTEQKNQPNLTQNALENESCVVKSLDIENEPVQDTYLQETQGGAYTRGASYLVVQDIYKAGFNSCYINLLEQFQARAYITVPIFCGCKLWGLLANYQNSGSRQWQAPEINIVVQIGNQLGVALQQAELLEETKRQATQLKEAKEAAEVANRAKSTFLANMSHELRTPLNAILGFTQLMNRDRSLSTEQQEHLDIILHSGEHLLALINDILEMSKIEAGRISLNETSFDLYHLLESLREMFHLKAQSKGLQLVFERTPDVPQYVLGDEGKLRQVLINLLGNAIKFTKSGRVMLRVKPKTSQLNLLTQNSKLKTHSSSPSHRLVFEVEDTGPGIAIEDIDSLFIAFTQTATGHQASEGTGLGLPISRQFVQLLGGDISVSSTLGRGATFTFDVLLKKTTPTDLHNQKPKERVIGLAPDQVAYRILLVEDTRVSRLLLVKLLTSVGFEVREAENGQEGLALWESWEPHLILMDMRMPVMDGYEATRQIKSHLKGQACVIIALTASAFEENRSLILSAGCDDFIRKPLQEDILFEKIAHHLGVRYLYEDSNELTRPQPKGRVEELTTGALGVMPAEWLRQLHRAAEGCQDEEILALMEQIPQQHEALKLALADLVDNFRFDLIIDLTQK